MRNNKAQNNRIKNQYFKKHNICILYKNNNGQLKNKNKLNK